jgi:hypothetical protein
MKRQTDGQTDGQTDEQTEGRIDRVNELNINHLLFCEKLYYLKTDSRIQNGPYWNTDEHEIYVHLVLFAYKNAINKLSDQQKKTIDS